MAECRCMLEALETACSLSVEVVDTTVTLPNHQTKAVTSAFVSAVLPDDEVVYMVAIPGFPLPKGKCFECVLCDMKSMSRRVLRLRKNCEP